MMFFPQTEEKISWYLKRALKKSYSVGTRKSKTSPSAEPVWAQLKGHAGTDTGMQARQPGTETRVSSDASEANVKNQSNDKEVI